MTQIAHLIIDADDPAGVADFYSDVLRLGDLVRVAPGDQATNGFRGFCLSLVVAQPANVDVFLDGAVAAGAALVRRPKKSLWGYGGTLLAPDGTYVTIATASRKDAEPVSLVVDEVLLQLGVDNLPASAAFYTERGLTIGRRAKGYAELETGRITLTLNPRGELARAAGVAAGGSGSHRLRIASDTTPFVDPDGFVWATA
ncbi:hypothetical protein ACQBAU_00655 [Propionibacteriaceae bacterium Y2011]|uniref:hypothetical protein n=1 Tax=Microlunatus sp. Y2014 TaxID=3418488 RepID=UPI003B4D6D6B